MIIDNERNSDSGARGGIQKVVYSQKVVLHQIDVAKPDTIASDACFYCITDYGLRLEKNRFHNDFQARFPRPLNHARRNADRAIAGTQRNLL